MAAVADRTFQVASALADLTGSTVETTRVLAADPVDRVICAADVVALPVRCAEGLSPVGQLALLTDVPHAGQVVAPAVVPSAADQGDPPQEEPEERGPHDRDSARVERPLLTMVNRMFIAWSSRTKPHAIRAPWPAVNTARYEFDRRPERHVLPPSRTVRICPQLPELQSTPRTSPRRFEGWILFSSASLRPSPRPSAG